jgi:hypothetical protein
MGVKWGRENAEKITVPKPLRPVWRPTHSAGAIIANVTNLARSLDQFNEAGECPDSPPGESFRLGRCFGDEIRPHN